MQDFAMGVCVRKACGKIWSPRPFYLSFPRIYKSCVRVYFIIIIIIIIMTLQCTKQKHKRVEHWLCRK